MGNTLMVSNANKADLGRTGKILPDGMSPSPLFWPSTSQVGFIEDDPSNIGHDQEPHSRERADHQERE